MVVGTEPQPQTGQAMSEQDGHRLPRCTQAFLVFVSMLFLFAAPAVAGEINACKYLVVTDFASDPYGIAKELRAQASKNGFVVVSSVTEVSTGDLSRTCVLTGSWAQTGSGGEIALRVVDTPNGGLIAEASTRATAWWSVSRTVRGAVAKIYSQLGYTGYSEETYRQRMQLEYPTRPTLAVTEEEIRKSEPKTALEGIWSDSQDQYRLGVVPGAQGSGADDVAVILRSNSPLWKPGEIKAEIRVTASPDVFTCTYFLANKKPAGTTLTLEHNSVLRGSLPIPKGSLDLMLMRVWPSITEEPASAAQTKTVASGTGFLLSRSGLLATNWHVVADAKNISVAFPGWNGTATVVVVVRDVANDLAVLRLSDSTRLATTCSELPFQLESSSRVKLGQRVSTIGYPLTTILGSNPKFSEGVVSSKSGFQDDPRTLQISAQVQPGSSGSPLFDDDGNIIGVVVATLDAGKVYQVTSAVPQNVNFAIKADYLLSLVATLPDNPLGSRTTAFTTDKAAQCVAIIRAW
jgi:S1-C subfamily serine protease